MPSRYKSTPLIKLLTIVFIIPVRIVYSKVSYFDLAKESLSKGDIMGTIRVYEEAIAKDPIGNCLAYYLLGNVHLTRGNINEAIKQYNHYQNHQCKQGSLAEVIMKEIRAYIRFGHLVKVHELIDKNKNQFDKTFEPKLNELKHELNILEHDMLNLDMLVKNNQCHEALELNEKLRNTLTHSNRLLKYKIQCFSILNDTNGMVSALKVYIKMNSDDIDSMLQLSQTYYSLCNFDDSLEYVRACLRSDQGNVHCLKHMRNVKKNKRMMDNLQNNLNNKNYKNVISQVPAFLTVAVSTNGVACLEAKALYFECHARSRLRDNPHNIVKICTNALEKTSNDIIQKSNILLSRGLVYIDLDMLDKAKNDIVESLSLQQTKEGEEAKEKVERLIKKKNKRDYYKILGVPRHAKDSDIKNAYRKLAVNSHPDKAKNNVEKEIFEKKFIDINHAREVLLDKDKRAQFDSGIDPLDAEEMAESNRNPYNNQHSSRGGNSFFSSDRGFFDFGGGHFTFQF